MRSLNRAATILAAAIVAMGILLLLILAGSVGLERLSPGDNALYPALMLGGHAAALAWPLLAVIIAALLALLALAIARREVPTPGRAAALLIGGMALYAAWQFGIRPPAERTGVFAGKFVYGHVGFRPDYLALCEDPAGPLPRGADLVRGALEDDFPLVAAVHMPERGWRGSHPAAWPQTRSDIHGTRYWLVRMRGTLRGPAQYGSPALMPYRLDVDSVLSVSPSRIFQDECGVHHPPAD